MDKSFRGLKGQASIGLATLAIALWLARASAGNSETNVKIELLKAWVVNRVIIASTANDGSFSWTIPTAQTVGTEYKIRITSTTSTSISDSSNANF